MLKQLIYRLGQQPKVSLKRFLIGIALFGCALAAIAYGYYFQPVVQIVGLIILGPAMFFALWGYLGIFANRFAQIIVTMYPDDKVENNDKAK
ncbi:MULTISPECIES: hypothetical protein [Pseudoalteromonas]|uniref:Uncharacterized protein n=1 Tax=Pseudoalteromonas amylolytica TaxID=1859457 RepID=A0A1S1MQW9_9GAMM|nr:MULTISPECIES: hypothetical protein [Pseudoalteromonas]MCF6435483.1 hypothetical protein [Pseudoalteromonas sp. MMG022]OHU86355.1 hypothetical protein BFC16_16780 [Pseudoalteromonas sp. JW3]OHU89540.1 hypothetical protein BET10_15540 [Pseudoalteromonas amylolytica]